MKLICVAVSACWFGCAWGVESQAVAKMWTTRSLSSGDGYAWTMTTRLGDMLDMAERMFGPRDRSWTILGVEMNVENGATPQNWYPGSPRRKDIVLQLDASAAGSSDVACYQLAHEVVHTLSPHVGKTATVLEEGVAAWFAAHYVKMRLGKEMNATRDSYREAARLVGEMLSSDSDAIRKLRKTEPSFDKITVETFVRAGVKCDSAKVSKLLSTFNR